MSFVQVDLEHSNIQQHSWKLINVRRGGTELSPSRCGCESKRHLSLALGSTE